MSNEKKIADIMVNPDNFIAVTTGAGFREVVGALRKSLTMADTDPAGETGAVLVYDNTLLAGIIGIEEVLNAIEPQFLKGGTYRGWTVNREWSIPVFWEGLFTDRCIEATSKKAGEIMKPVEFTVDAGDPLIKAVYGMTKHNTRYIPVMQDGLMVGVVRSQELFIEVSVLVSSSEAPVFALDRIKAPAGKAANGNR